MLVVGPHERGAQFALVVEHAIGFKQADDLGVEIDHGRSIAAGHDDMLDAPGQACHMRRTGARDAKQHAVSARIGEGHRFGKDRA